MNLKRAVCDAVAAAQLGATSSSDATWRTEAASRATLFCLITGSVTGRRSARFPAHYGNIRRDPNREVTRGWMLIIVTSLFGKPGFDKHILQNSAGGKNEHVTARFETFVLSFYFLFFLSVCMCVNHKNVRLVWLTDSQTLTLAKTYPWLFYVQEWLNINIMLLLLHHSLGIQPQCCWDHTIKIILLLITL